MSNILLPMLSFRIFMVSGLTFKSLIYFEFILIYGVRRWSTFIFFAHIFQFSYHHLLNRLSLPHCMFLLFLSNSNWPYRHEFIPGFSILLHWSICLFLCQHHAVLITMALLYSLIWGSMIPPTILFKIAVAIWGSSGRENLWI